jgi:hypothetical protein
MSIPPGADLDTGYADDEWPMDPPSAPDSDESDEDE